MRKQIARVQMLTEILQEALVEKLEYDTEMKAYAVEFDRMMEKVDTDGYKYMRQPDGISNAKIKRISLMLRQETIKLEGMLTV